MIDWQDRLIDTLLREMLGGEESPDFAARIMSRVSWRVWRRRVVAAAAAAVLIAAGLVGGWLALGRGYAEPTVSGDYQIEGGGPFKRGCVVLTKAGHAVVTRRGHYRIELDANSALGIEEKKQAEQVFLRQGGVTCDVDPAAGGFAVRTAAGTASVTGTRFAVRATGKEGEEMKMAVKVFIGSVLLSGAWGEVALAAGEEVVMVEPAAAAKPAALGKIEAGKPKYEPRSGDAWRERGRIVGHLRNAPECEIEAVDASGRVVKSTRPRKGARVYELQWLRPGVYTLRVAARGYQKLELKNLEVKARHDLFVHLEFTAGGDEPPAGGTIEASRPTYKPRTGEHWRKHGRIVGHLRDAPVCEIDVLDTSGRVVKSTRVSKGAKAYELEWLKPGVYTLRVAARGYRTLELKKLEVRARHDLFVNLEFTAGGHEAPAAGIIEASKPTYKPRTGEHWRERGRIVGHLRDAPACEIDVLDSSGRIVKSVRVSKGAKAYELQWLEPGVYTLRVSARGYRTLELKKLEVRARHDLFVNLEFGASG